MGRIEIEIDPDTLQTREEAWTLAHEQYEASINSRPNPQAPKEIQPKPPVKPPSQH